MTVNRRSALIIILLTETVLLIASLIVIKAGMESLLSEMKLQDPKSVNEVPAADVDIKETYKKNAEKPAIRLLGTISENSGSRVDIGSACEPYKPVAQSMAYTGSGFTVSFTDGPESHEEGVIKLFDAAGKPAGVQVSAPIYHANGMCRTGDGTFIVVRQDVDTDLRFAVDSGISELSEIYLPYSASASAYDRDSDKYILRTGPTVIVFSGDIRSETKDYSYKPGMHCDHYQDIGAGNGFYYSCHSINKDGENYIDVYSEETGEYYGSYVVDYGELESCDIVDGELVILVHIAGSSSNYLHFTGIRGI